jgi:large subunit ribosomal protein L24
MSNKLKIRKGDTVKVISGSNKGVEARVLKVIPEKNRAIVEGVNKISKHSKPSNENPDGGIVQKEAPIHISNLMVVDSKGKATRVGLQKDSEGKSVRFSKKSKEEIK